MITHQEYRHALNIIREYSKQVMEELKEAEKTNTLLIGKVDSLELFKGVTPEQNIHDTGISLRLLHAIRLFLWDHSINESQDFFVKDLSRISVQEFYRFRNVGKKTVKELQDLCKCAGITLKP